MVRFLIKFINMPSHNKLLDLDAFWNGNKSFAKNFLVTHAEHVLSPYHVSYDEARLDQFIEACSRIESIPSDLKLNELSSFKKLAFFFILIHYFNPFKNIKYKRESHHTKFETSTTTFVAVSFIKLYLYNAEIVWSKEWTKNPTREPKKLNKPIFISGHFYCDLAEAAYRDMYSYSDPNKSYIGEIMDHFMSYSLLIEAITYQENKHARYTEHVVIDGLLRSSSTK